MTSVLKRAQLLTPQLKRALVFEFLDHFQELSPVRPFFFLLGHDTPGRRRALPLDGTRHKIDFLDGLVQVMDHFSDHAALLAAVQLTAPWQVRGSLVDQNEDDDATTTGLQVERVWHAEDLDEEVPAPIMTTTPFSAATTTTSDETFASTHVVPAAFATVEEKAGDEKHVHRVTPTTQARLVPTRVDNDDEAPAPTMDAVSTPAASRTPAPSMAAPEAMETETCTDIPAELAPTDMAPTDKASATMHAVATPAASCTPAALKAAPEVMETKTSIETPTDLAPTDLAPTDLTPTDMAPADKASTDTAATDTAPTDMAPTDKNVAETPGQTSAPSAAPDSMEVDTDVTTTIPGATVDTTSTITVEAQFPDAIGAAETAAAVSSPLEVAVEPEAHEPPEESCEMPSLTATEKNDNASEKADEANVEAFPASNEMEMKVDEASEMAGSATLDETKQTEEQPEIPSEETTEMNVEPAATLPETDGANEAPSDTDTTTDTTEAMDIQEDEDDHSDNPSALESVAIEAPFVSQRPRRGRPAGGRSREKSVLETATSDSKPKERKRRKSQVAQTPKKSRSSSSTEATSASSSSSKRGLPRKIKIDDDGGELQKAIIEAGQFEHVKAALQKVGFNFKNGFYFRPRTNHSNGVLGGTMFTSVDDFRNDLCVHGVGPRYPHWTDEEADSVWQYVRYHVIQSVVGNGTISAATISGSDAGRFLRSLGFTHRNFALEGGCYVLPGVSRSDAVFGLNAFLDKNEPGGIWSHLGRHGLPKESHFDELSTNELFSLELYLTGAPIETFEYCPPAYLAGLLGGVDPLSTRRSRTSIGSTPSDDATAVSLDSKGVRPSRHSATKKSVVKKKTATPVRRSSPRANGLKQFSSSSTPSVPTDEGTPASSTARPPMSPDASSILATDASTASSRERISFLLSASPKVLKSRSASLSPVETPAPTFVGTDRERLQQCQNMLSITHPVLAPAMLKENTPGGFYSTLNQVYQFVSNAIDDRGGPLASMYVSGPPGVGKTSGIQWCCNQVIGDSQSFHDDEWRPHLVFVSSACLILASNPLRLILEEIGSRCGFSTWPMTTKALLAMLKKRKRVIVLVLDEVDSLISASSRNPGRNLSVSEKALQTLLECANNPSFPLCLIGISNCSSNDKYDRIQTLGLQQFKEPVIFQSYSEKELFQILFARVGSSVVCRPVLEFVAKRVSSSSGDARNALQSTALAVSKCLETTKEDTTSSVALVTIRHAHFAFRAVAKDPKFIVEGLPVSAKTLLCVLATLGEKGVKEMTIREAKNFVTEVLEETGRTDELLTIVDFVFSISTLVNNGLLEGDACLEKFGGHSDNKDTEIYEQKICLGIPLEEVQAAVADETKQHPFYQTLRDNALKRSI